ncbi:MAG: FAD-binding protein [Methanomassiliicoccus sp.]|nr:FAD-binding protein [Methanomassiliicoccus sp.]
MTTSPGCDVLVIGHGAAGCMAGAELAGRGLDVTVVGRGTPATALSGGRISLEGVERRRQVADRLRAMGRDHGLFASGEGRATALTDRGSIAYQDLTSAHDWLAITEVRTAVVGLRGNPDLDPDLACRSLSHRLPSLACRPLWADPGVPASVNAGRRTLSEDARAAIDALAGLLSDVPEDLVVLPPLFHGLLSDHALSELERSSGRKVREPNTPLSAPGRRLQECLEEGAARAGCRMLAGREVRSLRFNGGQAVSAALASGMREASMSFRAVVLAPGGLVGGGLAVRGCEVVDPLGLFSMARSSGRGLSSPELTAALETGIAERDDRAVLLDGTRAGNVFVAGSARPGMSFPLGRGLGHVMSSALEAAELVREVL